jgi:hypothetical protein
MNCGHAEHEIEHALSSEHTYAEWRIFGDLTLVLCNICMLDFGSFHPEFFGLPRSAKIGYEKMHFVRSIDEIYIGKDKYCSACGARLAFLKFVADARALHSREG